MNNFDVVSRTGNTMIDCAPKDYAYECKYCNGTGRMEFTSLVELFDYLDDMRYKRRMRGLMTLTFRTWMSIARDAYENGVACSECGGY